MSDATKHIHTVGRALWSSVNVGNPAPAVKALRDRMRRPRVGDLVMEVTSFHGFDPDGVGMLVAIEGDDPEHPDRWVVEPLDRPGEQQGWRNATFIALPTESASQWVEATALQEEG